MVDWGYLAVSAMAFLMAIVAYLRSELAHRRLSEHEIDLHFHVDRKKVINGD